jgi:hypothetical protein
MAKSMTIEEMRNLYARAMSDAEAKRTELKLVLASRYRELVGSSDEVIKMNERSQELHDLVHALPSLMEKLAKPIEPQEYNLEKEEALRVHPVVEIRRKLSALPRKTHRFLDSNNLHEATSTLIEIFTLIASQTDDYMLANALSLQPANKAASDLDPALEAQMRMVFLLIQTLPDRISRIATNKLLRSASFGVYDPALGAYDTVAALSSLDLLATDKKNRIASYLLDLYFDSKAKLLVSLLNQLQSPQTDEDEGAGPAAGKAEEVLSKIVLILQYDALLHPYQIFILRNVPGKDPSSVMRIMSSMPIFEKSLVRSKCSRFMATHLPAIRTKVKSVLVSIAGTTASALGQIRQSLYDRTDGKESMERLNSSGVCTWNEAVEEIVDVKSVLNTTDVGGAIRLSLWNALFSSTFSSLVHSLLTAAFQSVHTMLVSTLRTSLANAPPISSILPYEAYRNTLQIATDLNHALLKVKDDAHELLVHAEERVESERRLKESLYVHSCEILGRLVCELRRLVYRANDDRSEATKELIVGRLCYLLKFRLTALPTLLDPSSSPAAMHSTTGMISYVDLQSAFELGDHDEDGIISFDEAMQAVESAFSGTQFRGAEMVRDTLLLPSSNMEGKGVQHGAEIPDDVTLDELVLLTARGLRHEKSGTESALGAFQRALDKIIVSCVARWADSALESASTNLETAVGAFLRDSASASTEEWERMYSASDHSVGQVGPRLRNVSPHIASFMLNVSSVLNCNTCPSDFLTPVPSTEYASALGIESAGESLTPTLMHTLRWALLRQSLGMIASVSLRISDATDAPRGGLEKQCPPSLMQLRVDLSFILYCFFERNRNDFGNSSGTTALVSSHRESLYALSERVDHAIQKVCGAGPARALEANMAERHNHVLDSSDMFFSSILGESKAGVSAVGEIVGSSTLGLDPLFYMPLTSARRFALLPVPADRTITEIQLRGKFARDKEEAADRQETSSASAVVSSGLGFLSSMLKNR